LFLEIKQGDPKMSYKNFRKQITKIENCSYILSDLAEAFAETGNSLMFKKLNEISGVLSSSAENCDKYYRELTDEALNQVYQNTAGLLSATLAGISIGHAEASDKKAEASDSSDSPKCRVINEDKV
jgi:hypothetical protein